MLTFKFSGADGVMTVAETLTSGMVGKQVKLEFTSDWNNLTKTAVFEAGDISEAVYDVSDTATIPEAVLSIPRRRLKIGIYGEDAKGNVTPTIYATGPRIEEGADPWRAAASEPPMPKWKELEERIENLENGATGGGSGSDSGQNGNGLSTTASALLISILRNAVYTADQSANITALENALATGGSGGEEEPDTPVTPEKTLTSISAVYSGGDVAVGTAVTDLTGIVVTAHYSDGSTATVTGYTLSGTITEGNNTVTVSYGGKTTTFTVNGIESGGGTEPPKDFTRLQYIEGTGTQYIGSMPKTAPMPFESDKFELYVKFEFANVAELDGYQAQLVFTDTGTYQLVAFTDGRIRHDYVNNQTYGSISAVKDAVYEWHAQGNEVTFTNGVDTENYEDTITTMPAIYLFGKPSATNMAKIRLYEAYVKYDGTDVWHIYPALDSDGVACVYDAVSNDFIYNAGTGDFAYSA